MSTVLFAVTALAVALNVQAETVPGSNASIAAEMSEGLVYSVNRTPERIFDTARDVQVITHEQILQANVQSLGQLLARQLGMGVVDGESGTMPIVRGLGGKQVMFLIDGVKVNNATWRGAAKEYLHIFDLSQVERIEIVRGVVSVLGTESLGGVVNIITKKGQTDPGAFTTTISSRYATAENAFGSSVTASGGLGKVRFHAGVSFSETNEVEGGGGIGNQPLTGYKQKGGHFNGQWLLSPEKTVSLGFQDFRSEDAETPGNNLVLINGRFDPSHLQLMSLSYHDLTSRGWQDSLKLTVYRNRQRDHRIVFLRPVGPQPHRQQDEFDLNRLMGLNLELGTFVGSHHLVYGVDFTDETIESFKTIAPVATGIPVISRGLLMDGASYRSTSIYLQDKADLTRWLTVVGGLRAARFQAKGDENTAAGVVSIDTSRTNVTGSLSLIGHASPRLNVIANVMKGYRAPNLDDLTFSGGKPGTFTVVSQGLEPEKVLSLEGGVKYDGSRVQGSLFYFHNSFTNYIVPAGTTLNGLPFQDNNRNGRRDPGESLILQNQNVGEATIHGFDGEISVSLPASLSMHASYSHLIGTDEVLNAPLTLMPPASGTVSLRYSPSMPARPWGELSYRFAQAQKRLSATDLTNVYIGPNGAEAYGVIDLRGGLTLIDRLKLSVALENVTDEQYHFIASNRDQPGRQLVIGTQFTF